MRSGTSAQEEDETGFRVDNDGSMSFCNLDAEDIQQSSSVESEV
jgi:hypothetical protein